MADTMETTGSTINRPSKKTRTASRRVRLAALAATIAASAATLAACTWVKVDDHGLRVQAINRGEPPPENCQTKGQVEVSVLHEISFYNRDEEKIADELEKLARNEAGLMGGNVIQAVAPPGEGRQRFDVYDCP